MTWCGANRSAASENGMSGLQMIATTGLADDSPKFGASGLQNEIAAKAIHAFAAIRRLKLDRRTLRR
ncbi:MAG TPA: hypothetical protein VGL45_06225 [Bradyrhizobium sp.]|jgi:hypothetical protein